MAQADTAQRLAVAIGLVEEAGALALGYFNDRARLGTRMKGFQDWLTEADGAVETFLRTRLADAFPGDGFLGEEGGGAAARRLWIVDPIDGTANFARGEPHWCISVGYVEDGVPAAGVIRVPVSGEVFAARRGAGATLDGRPIAVARTESFDLATIEIGWSPRRPLDSYLALVSEMMRAGSGVKRSASGALGLAWTACGRTDAYLELHINSWDVAAGLVIAREAGAVVNDFFAGDGLIRGNPVLCSVPALAGRLADAMGIERTHLLCG